MPWLGGEGAGGLATGYRTNADGQDTVVLRYDESISDSDDAADGDALIAISALKIEEGAFSLTNGASYRSVEGADLVTTIISGSQEASRGIAVGGDGTVYTAGYSGSDSASSILIASYSVSSFVKYSEMS